MWWKFYVYLPMSKSKHHWYQCMPTSSQYTISIAVPWYQAYIFLHWITCTTFYSIACYTCTTFLRLIHYAKSVSISLARNLKLVGYPLVDWPRSRFEKFHYTKDKHLVKHPNIAYIWHYTFTYDYTWHCIYLTLRLLYNIAFPKSFISVLF